jgi:enolase-phosphatase E1
MSKDIKIAYLKSLQGHLWLTGYHSGALRCPLFRDVAPAMRKWHGEGKRIVIYSSGSVAAQKLLLQYTTEDVDEGDLRGLVSGWYDTVNAGMKNEASSYARIVREEQRQGADVKAEEWAFFSDNIREVEAAKKAGLKTVLAVRPGNAAVPAEEKGKYTVAETFEDVKL